jgi:hypothetical protein
MSPFIESVSVSRMYDKPEGVRVREGKKAERVRRGSEEGQKRVREGDRERTSVFRECLHD